MINGIVVFKKVDFTYGQDLLLVLNPIDLRIKDKTLVVISHKPALQIIV
jgi:ABC-type bacteriocin/lantibiotic exporter with double-glycine peptidase domain